MAAANLALDDQTKTYFEWLRQRGLPEAAAFRVQKSVAIDRVDLGRPVAPSCRPRLGFVVASTQFEVSTKEEADLLLKMREAMQLDALETLTLVGEDLGSLVSPLQAALIEGLPQIMVVFGERLAKRILGKEFHFSSQRGQIITHWQEKELPTAVLVTFHPRDMLRFPLNKKHVWKDFQLVKGWLAGNN